MDPRIAWLMNGTQLANGCLGDEVVASFSVDAESARLLCGELPSVVWDYPPEATTEYVKLCLLYYIGGVVIDFPSSPLMIDLDTAYKALGNMDVGHTSDTSLIIAKSKSPVIYRAMELQFECSVHSDLFKVVEIAAAEHRDRTVRI